MERLKGYRLLIVKDSEVRSSVSLDGYDLDKNMACADIIGELVTEIQVIERIDSWRQRYDA